MSKQHSAFILALAANRKLDLTSPAQVGDKFDIVAIPACEVCQKPILDPLEAVFAVKGLDHNTVPGHKAHLGAARGESFYALDGSVIFAHQNCAGGGLHLPVNFTSLALLGRLEVPKATPKPKASALN